MLLENYDCKMIELDCKPRLSADVSFHYTMRLRTRVPLLITLVHVGMRTSAQNTERDLSTCPKGQIHVH